MRNFRIALASGIGPSVSVARPMRLIKSRLAFSRLWKAPTPLLAKMGNEVLISP
jgi:hypothetical protein